jgi:4-amino-4-deoxy-L-arabinose transferase-like glycosyltransferase
VPSHAIICVVGATQTVSPLAGRVDVTPGVAVAVCVLVFHLALSGRYGFHRDELYYVAAGRHPAFGYVDQPPLVPLLARAVTGLAGAHLWPLRALAGAAHAGVVLVAAVMARDLGGGRRAVLVAALAAATAPLFIVVGSLFQTPIFDLLWSSLVLLIVVRLLAGADARWWLAVGGLVGLGLETKTTMALLAASLAVGLAAVPEARRHLRSPWLWAGAALALALWLPNLVWQALNDWPTAEFARNNNADVRAEEGRLGFVVAQVGLIGPVAVPLVGAGLWWLWRCRPLRALAVATAVMAAVLLAVGGKSYYLGPVYLPAMAAGAVATEGWLAAAPFRFRKAMTALAVATLVPLGALAPVTSVPVYAEMFQDLNPELGEEVGWPQMVDLVAAVADVLPAHERLGIRVVTASYGEAAAIDLYGPARGLPRGTALSAHNSYADWWPHGEPGGSFLTVRYSRADLAPYCDAIGPLARISVPRGVDNEIDRVPIHLCRGLRVTPEELREALRHYE